jgi:hypothetical protein
MPRYKEVVLRSSTTATVVTVNVSEHPRHVPADFRRTSGAINLAALHPGLGARAPDPASRNRVPDRMAWKASGYRVARPVAMVAEVMMLPILPSSTERTGLEPASPDRTSDQEIKSLLVNELADREGFEPSKRRCHSPLKASSASHRHADFQSAARGTGVRIPSGTPPERRRSP